MKKIITLAVILSCAFTSLAYADGPGRGPDDQQIRQEERGRGGPDGNHQQRRDDRRGDRHQARHEGDHFAWRGNDFRRGHPAPERFRGDDFRINDWRDRGLPPPPDGQHWSYINGNYVLIAAATGIITSILLNGALR